MSNVLNEEKQKKVLALGQLGWSLRQIEAATGIRRETAGSYLKAAGVEVRPPGGWGRKPKPTMEVTTDSPMVEPPKAAIADREVTTDPEPETPRTESACEPHREQIEAALARGRNAMSIWQTLVDQHGFAGAYESVKRFVRKLRGEPSMEACAIIETAPGEEAQVDYGTGPMVHDPATGKHRRTRLFVLTLGFSRKCVRLLTFQSSTRIWCELHQEAFRRLGGTPRIVVLDNLGEGVLKPDIYDPAINPLYRDLLQHYGVVAMPCRVRDPDRKGKVESGVGHAQKTPLKGMRFDRDLAEAQSYLDHWETRWADTRIHGTTKRQVAVMFAEEQPALRPKDVVKDARKKDVVPKDVVPGTKDVVPGTLAKKNVVRNVVLRNVVPGTLAAAKCRARHARKRGAKRKTAVHDKTQGSDTPRMADTERSR